MKRVAVVGAGIAGLRAAQCLARSGVVSEIVIFEKCSASGGLIQSVRKNGYVFEHGAHAVLTDREGFANTLRDLEENHIPVLEAPSSLSRYLIKNDRLVKVSPTSLFRNDILTLRGLVRALKEPFQRAQSHPRESLFNFSKRRFGEEVAQNLMLPLSYGIWAGGSRQLPIPLAFPKLYELENKFGSVFLGLIRQKKTKGKQKTLASFPEGFASLGNFILNDVQNQCEKQNIKFELRHGEVREIRSENKKISLNSADDFDALVLSSAPWQSSLHITGCESELRHLRNIKRHHIRIVYLGGSAAQFAQGFGALAMEHTAGPALGVIFAHSLFPEHCPKGKFLFRFMLGGERDENVLEAPKDVHVSYAKECLVKWGLASADAQIEETYVHDVRDAIPIMQSDYEECLEAFEKIENKHPGLVFAGYFKGLVSVSDALMSAEVAVKRVT